MSLPVAAGAGAEDPTDGSSCFTSASIVGAVLGSVLVLLAVEAVLYLLWRLYWRSRRGQHLVLVTDPEKGADYAFDNPCFREGGPVSKPVIDSKDSNKFDQKQNKWTAWGGLGAIRNNLGVGVGGLHGHGEKRRAMDDSFPTEPQVTQVSLRSHDFTGLGFNICGNMRDGIFVKDVLHRGPASESGLIFPGDRIHSIRISLRHMVFEDALTILSYASPYEVTLEVETGTAPAHSRPSSLLRRERERHQEQEQADRIVHPFYRSQSIADLAQIGKGVQKRPHAIDTAQQGQPGRVSPCPRSTLAPSISPLPYVATSTPTPAAAAARTERAQLEGAAAAAIINPSSSVIAKPERAKRTSCPSPAPAEQNAHNVLRLHTYTRERGIDVPNNYNPFLPASRTSGAGFDEVDLGPPSMQPLPDDTDPHHKMGVVAKEVKTKISKGIHNLLHSLDRRKSTARGEEAGTTAASPEPSPIQDLEEEVLTRKPSGRGIPTEIPEEVRLAALAARSNRKSLGVLSVEVDTEVRPGPQPPSAVSASSDSTTNSPSPVTHDGSKRGSNKRKAPRPPPPTELPLDPPTGGDSVDKMSEDTDSDSEEDEAPGLGLGSGSGSGPRTTIELTASHITIHHSPTLPEEENTRKAASLGDLSRIDSTLPSVNLLERAMSLDLADGAPQSGKKRKAPPAPSMDDDLLVPDLEDLCAGASRKEPRLEGALSTFERRLKKSSDWGTLEEALDFAQPLKEQVFVLSAPAAPEGVAVGGETGGSIFVGLFGKQSEPQDDQPFSFTATSETASTHLDIDGRHEPLSIEIRHESPLHASEESAPTVVHTSRVSVNSVASPSDSPSLSRSPSPGPDSGPSSLGAQAQLFSSTPLRNAPVRTQLSPEVLRANYITTTQLNSLEDPDLDMPSRSDAFVTAVDSILQDSDDMASPTQTLAPLSLSSPISSLTYITEIQVTPTPSDATTSLQNGVTFSEAADANPPSSPEVQVREEEPPKHNGSSSPPQTPDRESMCNAAARATKNVSVTAIQGSRIPVLRSTSHSPEDRTARTNRPPVPARRSTDQNQTPGRQAAARKVNGVQSISPDHTP